MILDVVRIRNMLSITNDARDIVRNFEVSVLLIFVINGNLLIEQ
jgi:hypothetical protein